jgi:hypothetical protein
MNKLLQILAGGLLVCLSMSSMEAMPMPQSDKDFDLNTVLMESTFKLEGQTAQGQTTIGTAFVMGRPYPRKPGEQAQKARYVLITAAHVLEEMQGDTATLYLRRKIDNDNWAKVPLAIPIRANGQPLWTKHPSADVAVMYIRLPSEVSIPLLSTDLLADDSMIQQYEIHPGDELKCLGYPLGLEANDAGFPVLRSGTIASYPLLPTNATKVFLFDFRVFKGNSGGPVYFVDSNRTYKGHTMVGESIHFIMGLVSGERLFQQQIPGPYSEEVRQLQLGLAQVVHASLIKEAINSLPSPDTLPD